MNRTRLILMGVVLLAGILALAATRAERMDRGDIIVETIPVEGAEFPKVHVEAVIDAPPQQVWKLVKSCAMSEQVNSRVKESAVVEKHDDGVICREEINMPFPIRDLTTIARWKLSDGPPAWTRSWELVEGDFDYANGAWTLTEYQDGQTHAVYENHFKPQINVPDWLAKGFLKVGMPGLMKDLRKAVND